jgi:hypothetical protein
MKAIQKVYWLRLVFGIVAALICAGYGFATGSITTDASSFKITTFLNNMSLAIIVYVISYFLIKNRFMSKVDRPQKLFTMGIGMFFLSWIVSWVLLYTLLATTF